MNQINIQNRLNCVIGYWNFENIYEDEIHYIICMKKNIAINLLCMKKAINKETYHGSRKVVIREGMDFNDS